MFLCDNVCVLCSAVGRVLVFFLCDDVGVLCSTVGRELGVFV